MLRLDPAVPAAVPLLRLRWVIAQIVADADAADADEGPLVVAGLSEVLNGAGGRADGAAINISRNREWKNVDEILHAQ